MQVNWFWVKTISLTKELKQSLKEVGSEKNYSIKE